MFDFFRSVFTVETVKQILKIAEIVFVLYLAGYSTFLFASVIVGSNQLFTDIKKRQLHNAIHHDYYVPISVIVPAYNEEVTIAQTIRSLLKLDYHTYEIVVVNDGSKDNTAQLVIDTFDLHEVQRPIRRQVACKNQISVYEGSINGVPITLINKENGGKADSINMGINAAKYPYFVCMDADSILQRDSLTKIATPVLENQNVVAVGSMIRISNDSVFQDGRLVQLRLPRKLIPAFQVLEYERSFLASRILLDKFNANLIISGAFGLFRKDAVINVGGYQVGSMGEDMELIVKLHSYYRSNRLPYSIKYAYEAVCWTQAPERLRDLCKQRKRWHLGLFQSMWRHRRMFTNPKFGAVSLISYTYFLFYELLSPFIEIFGVLTMILAYWVDLINVPFMLLFFLIYALFGSILSLTAFFARIHTIDLKLSIGDVMKAVLLCFFEITFLRFVMAFVRSTAFIGYKKKKLQWGRIERKKINLS